MELVIDSLEDVLPHIVPDTGIIHSEHDGYSVLNYVYSMERTFDSAIALECRGLKFGPDGDLIARPLHKFFNLGEKRPPQEEPWEQAHLVLDKLDGSMIPPALVKGDMVFMTRMGVTDHGRTALSLASDGLRALARDMLEAGFTAIFEYTGPENRIVVPYDVPELTLLAVRTSGRDGICRWTRSGGLRGGMMCRWCRRSGRWTMWRSSSRMRGRLRA